MVVFCQGELVGKAEGHPQLHPVVRLVRPVPAGALRRPELHRGQGLASGQLLHIVPDAVFVIIGGLRKALPLLDPEQKLDAGVHHRLALEDILEVVGRNIDICEYFQVRLPPDAGAGLFPRPGGLFQPADVLPLLKVEVILESIP